MNNRITGVTAIVADLRRVRRGRAAGRPGRHLPARSSWIDEIDGLRAAWPDTEEIVGSDGINPNVLMHRSRPSAGDAAVYVVDVGQHQMWAAQSLSCWPDQRFLTSGGLGSMGFGLPAAIGASFGDRAAGRAGRRRRRLPDQHPGAPDGGPNQLPLKMLIVNNRTHGMVRQFQQSYFDGRFQSTVWGYSAPDFAAVAAAYGIPSNASGRRMGRSGVAWLLAEPGPALLEVMVSPETNAYPKLAFGRPITEMEPLAQPIPLTR